MPLTLAASKRYVADRGGSFRAPFTVSLCVAKLAAALGKALDDPAVQARYVELGSSAPKGADRGPAALQKLVESEVATMLLTVAVFAELAGIDIDKAIGRQVALTRSPGPQIADPPGDAVLAPAGTETSPESVR